MKDENISNCHQLLMCPHCENETVTPQKMKICSLDGRVIVCDESEQKTTQDTDASTTKMINGAHTISVYFYCKSCKVYSEMYIGSHLGVTRFDWAKSVHIKSVPVDDKAYTKET